MRQILNAGINIKPEKMNLKIIKVFAIVFLLVSSAELKASLPANNSGARSSALGNTSITIADFWSQFNNQAGLADNTHFSIGTSYENRFLLKALSTKTVGILIPVNNGSFGLNIIHFGDANYNEMNIGLAYGRKLSENLSVGIQFDYFSFHQGYDYGSINKMTFEGGFIFKVDDKIKIGGHLYNPMINTKTDDISILPEIYSLGFEYLISKDLTGFFEVKTQSDFGSSLHFGLEYKQKMFAFRAGYASNPDQFTFGLGIEQRQFTLAFSSNLHPVLGYTPQLSIVHTF